MFSFLLSFTHDNILKFHSLSSVQHFSANVFEVCRLVIFWYVSVLNSCVCSHNTNIFIFLMHHHIYLFIRDAPIWFFTSLVHICISNPFDISWSVFVPFIRLATFLQHDFIVLFCRKSTNFFIIYFPFLYFISLTHFLFFWYLLTFRLNHHLVPLEYESCPSRTNYPNNSKTIFYYHKQILFKF